MAWWAAAAAFFKTQTGKYITQVVVTTVIARVFAKKPKIPDRSSLQDARGVDVQSRSTPERWPFGVTRTDLVLVWGADDPWTFSSVWLIGSGEMTSIERLYSMNHDGRRVPLTRGVAVVQFRNPDLSDQTIVSLRRPFDIPGNANPSDYEFDGLRTLLSVPSENSLLGDDNIFYGDFRRLDYEGKGRRTPVQKEYLIKVTEHFRDIDKPYRPLDHTGEQFGMYIGPDPDDPIRGTEFLAASPIQGRYRIMDNGTDPADLARMNNKRYSPTSDSDMIRQSGRQSDSNYVRRFRGYWGQSDDMRSLNELRARSDLRTYIHYPDDQRPTGYPVDLTHTESWRRQFSHSHLGPWTEANYGHGVSFLSMEIRQNETKGDERPLWDSIPQFECLVRGLKVPVDWSVPEAQREYEFTKNTARIVLWFLIVRMKVPLSKIDMDSVNASIAICDEPEYYIANVAEVFDDDGNPTIVPHWTPLADDDDSYGAGDIVLGEKPAEYRRHELQRYFIADSETRIAPSKDTAIDNYKWTPLCYKRPSIEYSQLTDAPAPGDTDFRDPANWTTDMAIVHNGHPYILNDAPRHYRDIYNGTVPSRYTSSPHSHTAASLRTRLTTSLAKSYPDTRIFRPAILELSDWVPSVSGSLRMSPNGAVPMIYASDDDWEATPDRPDLPRVIDRGDIPVHEIPIFGAGVHGRYTCAGVFESTSKPTEILEELSEAMTGDIFRWRGKWHVYAGQRESYRNTGPESERGPVPLAAVRTEPFTESEFSGEGLTRIQVAPQWKSRINEITVELPQSQNHDFKPFTFKVSDASKQSVRDSGRTLPGPVMRSEFIANPAQAWLNAQLAHMENRDPSRFDLEFAPGRPDDVEGIMALKPTDVIRLDIPQIPGTPDMRIVAKSIVTAGDPERSDSQQFAVSMGLVPRIDNISDLYDLPPIPNTSALYALSRGTDEIVRVLFDIPTEYNGISDDLLWSDGTDVNFSTPRGSIDPLSETNWRASDSISFFRWRDSSANGRVTLGQSTADSSVGFDTVTRRGDNLVATTLLLNAANEILGGPYQTSSVVDVAPRFISWISRGRSIRHASRILVVVARAGTVFRS